MITAVDAKSSTHRLVVKEGHCHRLHPKQEWPVDSLDSEDPFDPQRQATIESEVFLDSEPEDPVDPQRRIPIESEVLRHWEPASYVQ